jgi:6-phosphogluconolactonase (cycloisomerase 2 family)
VVFVGHRLSPNVFVARVDPNTGRFVGTGTLVNTGGPVASLDVDPSGTCLVVLRASPSALLVFAIDPSNGQLSAPVTIAPGVAGPSAVRFDPTGDSLHVLSDSDGRVALFRTASHAASATQPFEARSVAPTPSSISATLFGASGGASRIHQDLAGRELYTYDHTGRLVIRQRLGTVLNPSQDDAIAIPQPELLRALALSPHRQHLYAISENALDQIGVLRLFLQVPTDRTSPPITPGTQVTLRGTVRPADAQVDASGNWLRVLDESRAQIFVYPLQPSSGLPFDLSTTSDSSGSLRTEVFASSTSLSNGQATEFRAVWMLF